MSDVCASKMAYALFGNTNISPVVDGRMIVRPFALFTASIFMIAFSFALFTASTG
jgi:hypothetical protein